MLLVVLMVILVLGLAFYQYAIRPQRYWLRKGVKQGNSMPLIGDSWQQLFKNQQFFDTVEHIYRIGSTSDRYCGIYQMNTPILVLREPDLINQMMVRDGNEHFADRNNALSDNEDPILSKNLVNLKGKAWHDMRTKLSPSFTSSKMRQMFGLMLDTADQYCQYYLRQQQEQNVDIIELEMKDAFTRYTNDVIASTAFGIHVDSLTNRNNEFFRHANNLIDMKWWQRIKFGMLFVCPQLLKLLRLRLFDAKTIEFFKRIIEDTIETREQNGTYRPDMIQLMMEAKKQAISQAIIKTIDQTENKSFAFVNAPEDDITTTITSHPITNDDIVAQALIFFIAGFEGISLALCFLTYELAMHPDIHAKLVEEVDDVVAQHGTLTYNALLQMKYLDMVVSETLRKWPVMPVVDRICTKAYRIAPRYQHEQPIDLAVGARIMLPIYGLHRDPELYQEPDRFDPDRFNDDNRSKIVSGMYVPFGLGPHYCIAARFALLEVKTVIFQLLTQFEIVPIKRTNIPLQLETRPFSIKQNGGWWLGLKRRSRKTTM